MAAKPPLRELIKELMSPSGLLSENIKGFESRPEQVEMLLNVFDAYEKGLISLIEAGTGTGKSIAYLLPAILWAVHHKEKTLISTKTINLQEQLIEKDIPSLLKALGVDLRAVLVKGMGNYLCLRKWHDLLGSQNSGSEAEIDTIGNWVKGTQDGSLSSLTRQPSLAIWEQIAAEPDACDQARCPHYQECFFFKARREAQEAQLLIVNHHLLFADLRTRSEEGNWQNPAILPPYQRLILDEAHHIEEIATEYFASRVSRFEMQRVMGKLASDQPGIRMGKIGQLLKKIQEKSGKEPPRELSAIINRLTIDIQMEKRALSEQIHLTFDLISYFLSNHPSAGDGDGGDKRELKLRFKGEERDPAWQLNVVPKALELSKSCLSFIQSLKGIENDLKALENSRLEEALKGIFTDIKGLSLKLKTLALGLEAFLKEEHLPQKVKWVEAQLSKMGENQQLVTADLDIAPALSKALFDPFQTVILSSATLAAGRSFRFIKERIGISLLPHKEPLVEEHIYNSPFNFQQQALLVVPNDLPSANHPNYYQDIAAQVLAAIEASHGSAFVLFTSYHALSRCYSLVAPELIKKGFTLLKHGEDSRQALLKLFGEKKRPVLFGTDSFWEGVDVQGSGLKLVILVKLPFQVPNEPLVEAKKELFIAQGKDPFMEYSLPNAVVKFKQGFGRLIRRKSDYGVVLCLDPRLIQKGYGRLFLSSLPDCPLLITPQKELASHLKLFYKKQYRRRLGAS